MTWEKFVDTRFFELSSTAFAIVLFFVINSISRNLIEKQARKHGLDRSRSVYTKKFFGITWFLLLLVSLGFIWEISFAGLFASFFAIAGVALFANWSILSNVTSSVILFFYYPFKIGSRIRILDGGDNSVEGIVKDITFFAIQIQTDEGDSVSFPNNVAMQKAIMQIGNDKA